MKFPGRGRCGVIGGASDIVVPHMEAIDVGAAHKAELREWMLFHVAVFAFVDFMVARAE